MGNIHSRSSKGTVIAVLLSHTYVSMVPNWSTGVHASALTGGTVTTSSQFPGVDYAKENAIDDKFDYYYTTKGGFHS